MVVAMCWVASYIRVDTYYFYIIGVCESAGIDNEEPETLIMIISYKINRGVVNLKTGRH